MSDHDVRETTAAAYESASYIAQGCDRIEEILECEYDKKYQKALDILEMMEDDAREACVTDELEAVEESLAEIEAAYAAIEQSLCMAQFKATKILEE